MLYRLHHSCLYATGSTLIPQQHTGMDVVHVRDAQVSHLRQMQSLQKK